MKLFHHIEKHEEFFLPSKDGLKSKPIETFVDDDQDLSFSDVEAVSPTTEVQRDVLKEDVQWTEALLFSGKASVFDQEKVSDAWRSLAYHRMCFTV